METEFDTLTICPGCRAEAGASAMLTACPVCSEHGRLFVPITEWFRGRNEPLLGRIVGGRYAVIGFIGKGGMGDIFRAVHLQLGRQVALKILRRSGSTAGQDDAALTERFDDEAHFAAHLNRPDTVALLDAGTDDDGRRFMAFELLRGQTLEELLEVHGPLPALRVAAIGERIAQALEGVHAEGLLHADLKPANVMCLGTLADEPEVKLLDFGLSRLMARCGQPQGVAAGTLEFMAPEQMVDAPCDARTDVYGLAATLHRLVTGLPTHERGRPRDVLARKRNVEPAGLDSVPGPLACVLRRGLHPEPGQRHPSAAVFAAALARAADDLRSAGTPAPNTNSEPVSIRTERRAGARFGLAAVAAAALAMLIVGSGEALQPNASETSVELAPMVIHIPVQSMIAARVP